MSAPGPARAAAKSRSDWETPWDLFNAIDREFYFSLDGAANAENYKVRYYLGPGGIVEDAFTWSGGARETIWVNPPYGKAEHPCKAPCDKKTCQRRGHCIDKYIPGLDDWIGLFDTWHQRGHTVVALVPNATDAGWFAKAAETAREIRLMVGRVEFAGGESGNTGGNALVVWRYGPRARGGHIWLWDWRR